jgi:hypothetical protein
MAEYSHFLGRKVTVRYRVGDILLSASGTFAADSGRSIFLEQHIEQHGAPKYFRWEVPYPYIYRIEEGIEENPSDAVRQQAPQKAAAAAAGEREASAGSVIPFPQRPKTA